MRERVESARTAADVESLAGCLWGPAPGIARGVVQPFAAIRADGAWRALRVDAPGAPASPLDAFALAHTRARVDAIVTSGRNLREEPGEGYGLPVAAGALARWRRERAGRSTPPALVVITSGRDLDLDHPAFAPGRRRVVYTGADGGARLASRARRRGVELWVTGVPAVDDLLRRLLRDEGARLVSVEAGPTASRALYAADAATPVDELILTEVRGPLAGAAVGPRIAPLADLDARYPEVGAPSEHADGDLALRFARRRRTRPPPP